MANLNLTATSSTSLNWYISGLGFPWNQYSQAKITSTNSSSAGALASATPDSSDTNTYTPTRTLSSGLTGGNTYTLYGWVMNGGTWYSTGSATITMPLPTAPSVYVSNRIDGGFVLSWDTTALSNATSYHPEYSLSGSSSWNSLGSFTSSSTVFTPNSYGAVYQFRNRAYLSTGSYSNYSGTTSATVNPSNPHISGVVTNGVTFTVYASGMTGNWSSIEVERLTASGSLVDTKTITVNGGYAQWTNVPSGSTYKFRARGYLSSANLYSVNYSNMITLENLRPDEFSWTNGKVQGNNFSILATEWNRLCSVTNEFRIYKGLSTSSFSTAYKDNPVLASMFNQVRNSISGMSPTLSPPSVKSINDDIKASDLNLLRNSLNSIT